MTIWPGVIHDHQYVWNNSFEYDMIRWINNTHMDHALTSATIVLYPIGSNNLTVRDNFRGEF